MWEEEEEEEGGGERDEQKSLWIYHDLMYRLLRMEYMNDKFRPDASYLKVNQMESVYVGPVDAFSSGYTNDWVNS